MKKYAPFRLNCFGVLGILLILNGIGSMVFVYYAIMEIMKWLNYGGYGSMPWEVSRILKLQSMIMQSALFAALSLSVILLLTVLLLLV